MKLAITALLAACSIATVAEELKQPAPTGPRDSWVVPEQKPDPGFKLLPDGSLQLSDGRVLKMTPEQLKLLARPRSSTCYFIRTLRPVLPDDDARRSGIIPLQARVAGVARAPDCSNGGELRPLIPVQAPDTAAPAGPALTAVADR